MIWALFISMAVASENWLCTSESSQMVAGQVKACGIGLGDDEDAARAGAFDSAKAEFSRLCDASSDCHNHAVNVEPKRTTCDESGGKWKCYRLLVFTVGEEIKVKDTAQTAAATVAAKNVHKGVGKNYTVSNFLNDWMNRYKTHQTWSQ